MLRGRYRYLDDQLLSPGVGARSHVMPGALIRLLAARRVKGDPVRM